MTSNWQTFQMPQQQRPNDKNYRALNKLATKQRVTTSAAQYRFRQQQDVRLANPLSRQAYIEKNVPMQYHSRTLSDSQDNFAFGMPNRPSTPIRTVVNGVYGVVADFEITNRQADIAQNKRTEKVTKPSKAHTRASTLAQDQILRSTLTNSLKAKDHEADLFKLNKFKNINSRVGQHHTNDPRRSRQGLPEKATLSAAFQTTQPRK